MLSKISPVPLVLSGYCPYLPSIHPGSPFRNVFNNTVSSVSFRKGCLEWLVWFAISYFAISWGPYHSCFPDGQMESLFCHHPGKVMHCRPCSFIWLLKRRVAISITRWLLSWPRGYTIIGRKVWVCCLFFFLGHNCRLGVVVPRPRHRKLCLLTSLLHTSCLIREA